MFSLTDFGENKAQSLLPVSFYAPNENWRHFIFCLTLMGPVKGSPFIVKVHYIFLSIWYIIVRYINIYATLPEIRCVRHEFINTGSCDE